MPREPFSPENAPTPGGPYSPVVRVGSQVWTAGQCGYRVDRSLVEGLTGQVRQALNNLFGALVAAGASESDVVAVNVYLANGEDFEAMNEVYRTFFTQPYPVRATITSGLRPGVLFEVDAQAVLS